MLHCLAGLCLTVVESSTAKILSLTLTLMFTVFEKTSLPLLSGLWNLVFLFSNLSLVFLMPFAYFFTESEGFAGSRKVAVFFFALAHN